MNLYFSAATAKVNFDVWVCTDTANAQVLLRWATQRGIAVVPKSNQHERLIQNLKCTDFDLTEEQIKEISGLNVNLRQVEFERLLWLA